MVYFLSGRSFTIECRLFDSLVQPPSSQLLQRDPQMPDVETDNYKQGACQQARVTTDSVSNSVLSCNGKTLRSRSLSCIS